MTKKCGKVASASAVLFATLFPAAVWAAAPAPTLHNDNPTAKAGDWYTGAIPPNVDYSKPVLLFVQGLHADYTTWTSGDDYYDAAYNNGYRTAFVQLQDADGPGGNMWTNGQILANVIKKVANYYGVKQINIISHSKGGIDTQAALDYYGASPYVNVVQQLSTPNLGSELADLSYGSWTWWIGALMGTQDDAVYSLQTSYMKWFRSITDPLVANKATRYYMADGTGDDGWFSATWFAHAVLPGKDDGAVADYSALGLPYGVYDFTDDGWQALSHSMMHAASKTWWEVQPELTTRSFNAAVTPQVANVDPLLQNQAQVESSNTIMRGGAVNGTVTDTFSLESGLGDTAFDVMTSSKATEVNLISPSGQVYTPIQGTANVSTTPMFTHAVHHLFVLPSPEAGTWKVQLTGQQDAYFLYGALNGGANAHVTGGKKVYSVSEADVHLHVAFDGAKVSGKQIKAHLHKANRNGRSTKLQDVALQPDGSGGLNATFATPAQPGVYNVSFDITGVNARGETLTRSVNYNFAVTDANGQLPGANE